MEPHTVPSEKVIGDYSCRLGPGLEGPLRVARESSRRSRELCASVACFLLADKRLVAEVHPRHCKLLKSMMSRFLGRPGGPRLQS